MTEQTKKQSKLKWLFAGYVFLGFVGMLLCGYGYAAMSTDLLIEGKGVVRAGTAKLLYAPMDGVGYVGDGLNSFYDKISMKKFEVLGEAEDIQYSTTQVKFGKRSAYFAGGQYQRLNNASMSNLDFGTGDFTVSFWAYQEPHGYLNTMPFGSDDYGSATFEFFLKESGDDNYMSFLLGDWTKGWTRILTEYKAPIYNQWVHYALVRRNGVLTAYENGRQVARTADYVGYPIEMTNFSVGGFLDINTSYKGYIDDFAIYDYAKYAGAFTPPTVAQADANVLYMDFEEISPSTKQPVWEEVSGDYFSVLGGAYLEGRNDKYKFGGAALYFPGELDQRIQMEVPSLNLGAKDFTVSFWAYQEAHEYRNSAAFGTDRLDDGAFQFLLKDEDSDGMMALLYDGERFLYIPKTPTLSQWVHYAVVRKDGAFAVYQNGKKVAETGEGYEWLEIDMSDFVIGGHSDINTTYKGYIDDFVIYNQAMFEDDFTPPDKPASAW